METGLEGTPGDGDGVRTGADDGGFTPAPTRDDGGAPRDAGTRGVPSKPDLPFDAGLAGDFDAGSELPDPPAREPAADAGAQPVPTPPPKPPPAQASCSDTPEICDGRDNDCDGLIDEDVKNACGGCEALALHPTILPITTALPLQHRARCSAGGRDGTLLCFSASLMYCRVGVEICTNELDDDADGYRDECEEQHTTDVRIRDHWPPELE